MKRLSWILLPLLMLAGIYLRLSNIYIHNLYPDSYQNLLVAQNLATYKSVVGYLGKGGMLYPDFFIWTHPVYPLLINLAHIFIRDELFAAHMEALATGILAIPIAYFFVKSLFKSHEAGLIAAALLATSFNHTVWSGFTLTETTGVLFLSLFLWSYFSSLPRKSTLFSAHDFLTGITFSLAVFTRYEYVILALPVAAHLFLTSKKPILRMANITIAFVLTSAFFVIEFFPLDSTLDVIKDQLPDLLKLGGLLAAVLLVFFWAYVFLSKKYKVLFLNWVGNITPLVVILPACYLLLQSLFPQIITIFAHNTQGIREFYANDLLLALLLVVGLVRMVQESRTRSLGFFVLGSSMMLGIIYYRINPTFSRYHTHLIPLIIIPAAYGGVFLLKRIKKLRRSKKTHAKQFGIVVLVILIGLFIWQVRLTAPGIKDWEGGRWTRDNYEEKAAKSVAKKVDKSALLLVSYPEPYYYFSGISTYSMADTAPYIYINNSENGRTMVIVQDMGMRYLFPNFSNFLDKNLQRYRMQSFWVHDDYHYVDYGTKETHPIVLYEVKLSMLKKILRN